jgi:hypothetical protein
MKVQSNPPIFLVGCPRSGTTLLQSLLAAHPDIASFRESKFFHYVLPEYEPRRRALGLVSRQLKPRLERYFRDELGRPEMLSRLPRIIFMGYYTRKFIEIMYLMTQEQGKHILLEKTPDHIYKINWIEKLLSRAKFIHIVRNGVDVIASLYEITHKYPRPWGGAHTIDMCIEKWKRAIVASRDSRHKPNHYLVQYEALVANPRPILENLCQFIGVEFHQTMLQDYRAMGKQLSLEHEGRAVRQDGIQNATSQKFYQVFDAAQRQYIREQLATVNLAELIQDSQGKN